MSSDDRLSVIHVPSSFKRPRHVLHPLPVFVALAAPPLRMHPRFVTIAAPRHATIALPANPRVHAVHPLRTPPCAKTAPSTPGGDRQDMDAKKGKGSDGDMTVYGRNGRARPSGDLPFDVSVVSPPPRFLGRFQLDPHTHCGDIVEHDGHHFEVKVVRIRYRLREGRFQVIGKAIEVKSLARKAIEVYLERSFNDS